MSAFGGKVDMTFCSAYAFDPKRTLQVLAIVEEVLQDIGSLDFGSGHKVKARDTFRDQCFYWVDHYLVRADAHL
jgi:hypothetical protein